MNWIFNHIDFSTYPNYDGDDLGCTYSKNSTKIKVWAPTAEFVKLRIYSSGDTNSIKLELIMDAEGNGIKTAVINGNFANHYYTIQCRIHGEWMNEIPDIYAKAVGLNGKRAMICNFEKTNPIGWENDKRPLLKSYTDAVLYEMHVRDISIDNNSGIQHKGKFLGLTELGTISAEGLKTGIDHLIELGITHVHLLPVCDFYTVDESVSKNGQYNWGYDPLNFNALEGWYATDATEGSIRILEFKQLVKAFHDVGIGVVMDVVYNHTGLINESYFNQTIPGYFYRQRNNGSFSDASGCGTEIASERYMVRKYMIESLVYWAEEYHLDGFRFDLMGIYDTATMNEIRHELDKVDPHLLLYGEGWTAAESPLSERARAVKSNASHLERIALFSDDFRDAIKGHWSNSSSRGFASGLTLDEESVKFGIVGACRHPQIVYGYVSTSKWAWSPEPIQCINYISCHDNYTLFDKLKLSYPTATDNELSRMASLAGALLLTSQGVPFLHSGVEFLRTKNGDSNSYKSSDEVNKIDWKRKSLFNVQFNYFKKLISLRKAHSAFRIPNADTLRQKLRFSKNYIPGVVAYELGPYANGDSWKWIQLIFNNNKHTVSFDIEQRNWTEIAREFCIDEAGIRTFQCNKVIVPPVSMLILMSNDKIDK